MLNRRDMLKLSALVPAGAAVAGSLVGQIADAAPADGQPTIKRYRTLGKTGQKISDLSMGGGSLAGPALIAKALSLGITYFDTAPDYGDSEKIIGEGWRRSSVSRDKFHITTKICEARPYPGHAPKRTPEKKIIEWVEASLKRLRTDYVDNLFVHAVGERGPNDVDRLRDPEMLNAVEKLKKAGKYRFLGCSSHGPHKPLESLRYAIESGQYDVIMPAYNLYAWPGLDEVLKLAQAKNIGVIAMKTLRGGKQAKEKGVLPKGDFAHASFKWVWSNPAVAGLIVTIRNESVLDNYARASGGTLASYERDGLTRMAALTSSSVCRIGCGECLSKCPNGVSIPNVLRQDMYYTEYGEVARARAEYAEFSADGLGASACLSCTDQRCVNACPNGLEIRPRMLGAHKRLAIV